MIKAIFSVTLILFSVIDIFGSLPVVINLKRQGSRIHPGQATAIAGLIMILFLFFGTALLGLFGVDIQSFALAGSLIIFFIGLEMVLGIRLFRDEASGNTGTVVPIAFPIIAGAGTLTTIISLKAEFDTWTILAGIGLNLLVVFLVLRSTGWIAKKMGEQGLGILRKVFGIILIAICFPTFQSKHSLVSPAHSYTVMPAEALPEYIHTEAELDALMTRPTAALTAFVRTLRGPLVVLGAGGKMGPSLCVQARRAAEDAGHDLEVVAVSRFTNPAVRAWLGTNGVQTLACDLMDRTALDALPDAENVIYLVGLKFGTQHDPARTWAVNTLIPAFVAERYARARIVALSTGNVYPMTPVVAGGSVETDALTPLGEYANACVARERIFGFYAERHGTPVVLIRLNYAIDLRYGVLVDITQKVRDRRPVDVTMGYLNCIWQGDANAMIVRALALAASPAKPLNLTGPACLAVRDLALRLGVLLDRPVEIEGTEADTALLSNPAAACAALGMPPTPLDTMLRWTAHWIKHDGATLNKPAHFDVQDGKY